jgi:glycosyltransferase involved in cell wall biosynthesis
VSTRTRALRRGGCALILVTAAIPTYNRARFLAGALESILAQTFRDFEVLVVDDGSTDETSAVLATYGDRIRVVRQENQGRSAARNRAVREARGRYVSFLDSDDCWLPEKLERQVPLLEADPRVAMAHGHVDVIAEDGRPLAEDTECHRRLFSAAHRNPVTYAGYALDCRCFSSAMTARVEALERVGLYDPGLLLDDYDVYLRLALEYEIQFLHGPPVAVYRLHPGQMTTYELTMGQIQTAMKHLALLEERPDVRDRALARRNFLLMLARSYAVLGEQRQSRHHLLEALRLDPGVIRRPWVAKRLVASFVKR